MADLLSTIWGLWEGRPPAAAVPRPVYLSGPSASRAAGGRREPFGYDWVPFGIVGRLVVTSAAFRSSLRVNGAAGFVVSRPGRPFSVAGFTFAGGRVVEIDLLADPDRLRELDLTVLDH
jgi:hypothetical protein